MEEVLIFIAKVLIFITATAAIFLMIGLLANHLKQKPELNIEPIHKKFKEWGQFLSLFSVNNKKQLKELKKKFKEEKSEPSGRLYVLNFEGDIRAAQVNHLREEITAILQVATEKDEVLVKLDSPGGMVHGYGLGASQLLRIREKNIPLVVSVDKVAASGGYLMACVASKIVAAPFAVIGSIGVLAQVPNFYRLLRRFDVDYKEYTAGEFKRTVSLLGEITSKGEQKLQEQIEDTHVLFKSFVQRHRPQLHIEEVATGEYWYGEKAKELGLIDQILTSDDYILKKFQDHWHIFEIRYQAKEKLLDKVSHALSQALILSAEKVYQKFDRQKYP